MKKITPGKSYAITKGIYPPQFSVIELLGGKSYSHVKSFRLKKDAAQMITDGGGVLSEYI